GALKTNSVALEIRQKAKLTHGMGHSHLNLGQTLEALFLYAEAKSHLDSAVFFLDKTKDYELAGDAYFELSILNENLLDYQQGLIYAEKAFQNYSKAPFSPEYKRYYQAFTHQNIADLHSQLDQFDSAIIHYQKASVNYRSLGMVLEEASCLNNVGAMYLNLEQWQQAKDSLQKAASIFQQEPHSLEIAKILSNLGIAYKHLGKWKLSERLFHESLQIYQELITTPKHPEFAKIYDNLGDIYELRGDLENALFLYQAAIKEVIPAFFSDDPMDNPKGIDTTFILGQKSELLTYLVSKARILQSLAEKSELPESYLQAALQNYLLADSLIFRMRGEHYTEGAKLFWLAETRAVYEKAIDLCIKIGEWDQAFLLMEKSKAILLLGALEEAKAKNSAGIPDSLLEKEKQLKEAILVSQLQLTASLQAGNTSEAAKLRQKHHQRLLDFRQFSENLARNYAQYFAYQYQTRFADIAEVQTYLSAQNDSTVFLEYFEGDSAIYLILIAAHSKTGWQIPRNDSLVNDFLKRVSRPILQESETYRKIAYALFQKLLSPALKTIDKQVKQLIIIPDGHLASIPFDALLTDSLKTTSLNQFPFLIKTYHCRYAFSASVFFSKMNRPKNIRWNLLGVAPIEFEGLGQPLFPLSKSGDGVKMAIDNLGGKALIGNQASLEKVKENAQWAEILYFFTHASVANQFSPYPWIAFRDSAMVLPEIYGLETAASLVVLGACETLAGDLKKGEGVMNFARAFRYIGVESIVATLWQAEEGRTVKILGDFFERLKAGKSSDQALYEAKLAYLSQAIQSDQASPYYWACFTHTGESVGFSFSESGFGGQGWWILGIVLAAMILGGGWLIGRRLIYHV
ncbi:MAG: CHAT domain-containing protein, partial [Bacteroidetes bacterium]|nr:CHAT domain-containing protein [Bacteroidota bacterium]